MTEKMREKRELLKTLSRACVQVAEVEGINLEEYTVNNLIMKYAYNPDYEYNFKSFAGWKNDGYTVKKGSKAYIVWGQPVSTKREEQKKQDNEEEKDKDFFPIAYIFRNDQVIKPIRKIKPTTTRTTVPKVVEDLPL